MTNFKYFNATIFWRVGVDRYSGWVHIYDDPRNWGGPAVPEAVMTPWRWEATTAQQNVGN